MLKGGGGEGLKDRPQTRARTTAGLLGSTSLSWFFLRSSFGLAILEAFLWAGFL